MQHFLGYPDIDHAVTTVDLEHHLLTFCLIRCTGMMYIRLMYGDRENTRAEKMAKALMVPLKWSGSRVHMFVPRDSQRK